MSDNINDAVKGVMTGELSDRLRAKAAVASAGMASVQSMIDIMREAAAEIDRLTAIEKTQAPRVDIQSIIAPPHGVRRCECVYMRLNWMFSARRLYRQFKPRKTTPIT